MNDHLKGLLITLCGVLCVVPDSLFVRLISADASTIAFWRLLLAGGATVTGLLVLKGAAPFRAVLATGSKGALYMLGVGGSGALFVHAVNLTSVANVVLIIASMPLFASVFSWIFLSEPISRRMWLTMAAVGCGLAVIASGTGGNANASLYGDALALVVSALFAIGLTAARLVRHVSMVPAAGMSYVIGALLLLPFAQPLSVPASQIPLVLGHATCIMGSSVLLALGPRFITSAEVAILVLLESVLAPLLAWAVIGEYPGRYSLFGGAIVVGALLISNLTALRRKSRAARAT